jgi:hypothetical protein
MQADFLKTITTWHNADTSFRNWSQRPSGTNYRVHVAMYTSSIRDQAFSVSAQPEFEDLRSHTLWKEMGCGEYTIDQQQVSKEEKKVVTPYVGTCFRRSLPKYGHRKFDLLEIIRSSTETTTNRFLQGRQLEFPPYKLQATQASQQQRVDVALLLETAAIRNKVIDATAAELIDKIVIVRLKTSHGGGKTEPLQFALVKKDLTATAVRMIWLVQVNSTMACYDGSQAYYPSCNELFSTDNCNCHSIPLKRIIANPIERGSQYQWRNSSTLILPRGRSLVFSILFGAN